MAKISRSSMRWAVQMALRGEIRNVYKILVGNAKGKRPLE
jgi:hypothetical protein